jgi:hypothetical protein
MDDGSLNKIIKIPDTQATTQGNNNVSPERILANRKALNMLRQENDVARHDTKLHVRCMVHGEGFERAIKDNPGKSEEEVRRGLLDNAEMQAAGMLFSKLMKTGCFEIHERKLPTGAVAVEMAMHFSLTLNQIKALEKLG